MKQTEKGDDRFLDFGYPSSGELVANLFPSTTPKPIVPTFNVPNVGPLGSVWWPGVSGWLNG